MPETTRLREVLAAQGAVGATVEELVAYATSRFTIPSSPSPSATLPDEPFVAAWAGYAGAAERRGLWPVLREALVQLRFPVTEGMSQRPAYLAATRRGDLRDLPEDGVALHRPGALELFLHPTPAGQIPVLAVEDRHDFVTLVQALTRRNEPAPIPASMGACCVAGYINWDRVGRWRAARPTLADDWFEELRPNKELYQDRFIILSSGPYSGVPAEGLGLDPQEWRLLSRAIRLEHESTHYVTRRLFGAMQNSLLDELIADFMGIVSATGTYRGDWFLRFMGLECFPQYRAGGRLENYRGTPPLSPPAFHTLCRLLRSATRNLERFAATCPPAPWDVETRGRIVTALAAAGLEHLAGTDVDVESWLTGEQQVALG
jgi:Family of unknown function (DUF7005)